ncbi:MAG: serine/threonine-protein kinase [Deltaproteobacteria bacterium]|nr:serine/threonine-protein kinase [Deltaproteobacteria bacterium]
MTLSTEIRCCVSCSQLFASESPHCPRCATTLLPTPEGPVLFDGRYLVEKELGRGGAGRVLLARDVPLRRRVAIKLMVHDRPSSESVDAFYREASSLASTRSEHVAQVYSFGICTEGCFFAMEFIGGSSLAGVIDEHRRAGAFVPKHRAVSVLKQVAQGLAAVHATGVIHRDIKPSNIVIERDTGRAALVDFGIAIHRDELDHEDDVLHGTPAYMAPEQIIDAGGITPLADVYALGCTAFELLTNRIPFIAESVHMLLAKHVSEPAPSVSALRPELGFLDPIVQRAMAKEPSERYESAQAFAAALDHALFTMTREDLSQVPAPTQKRSLGGAAIRVLIVDDDPVFGVFASRAVKTALGIRPDSLSVTVMRSGIEALQLEGAMPNLVILDYHMPGLSGVEVLSVLRERAGGREMRVIVASGSAGPEALARFALLGVADFVKKPADYKVFVQRLREIGVANNWIAPVADEHA